MGKSVIAIAFSMVLAAGARWTLMRIRYPVVYLVRHV